MKHRKAHWVPEATCQFRTGVLKKKKKNRGRGGVFLRASFWGEWTVLAALHLEMSGGRGHRPRAGPCQAWGVPQDGCDLWGSAAVTASALGPLPPPDKQVIRRGAEVLAELPGR